MQSFYQTRDISLGFTIVPYIVFPILRFSEFLFGQLTGTTLLVLQEAIERLQRMTFRLQLSASEDQRGQILKQQNIVRLDLSIVSTIKSL